MTLDFKTIYFESFILWENVARKTDFTAESRTHSHGLYARVLGQFVCFYLKKASHAMLPSEGSHMDDPNQNTHPRMSAHHEDPNKTANRSC